MSKDQITNMLQELGAKIDQLRASHTELDHRLRMVERHAPAEARAMTQDAVSAALQSDPCTRFEVLADWTHGQVQFSRGQVIRADHYRYVKDYVASGLLLGPPRDMPDVVAQLRAESEARVRAMEVAAQESVLLSAKAKEAAEQARKMADSIPGVPVDDSITAARAAVAG